MSTEKKSSRKESGDQAEIIKIAQSYERGTYNMTTGLGMKPDYESARFMYEQLAEDKNNYANYKLGEFYRRGLGVPPDENKAAEYYKKAERRNYKAAIQLYLLYAKGKGGGNLDQAMDGFCKWLDTEDRPPAFYGEMAFHLADCYVLDHKPKQAVEYYTMAAKKGDLRALVKLAEFYQKGYPEAGIAQNLDQATKYLNDCIAGIKKRVQKPKPYDAALLSQAQQMLEDKAEKKDKKTHPMVMTVLKRSIVHELRMRAEKREEIRDWIGACNLFEQAAAQGDRSSCLKLGEYYEQGKPGIVRDGKKAFDSYQQALQLAPSSEANYRIGKCYAYGIGVEKNPIKALEHFQNAVKHEAPCLYGILQILALARLDSSEALIGEVSLDDLRKRSCEDFEYESWADIDVELADLFSRDRNLCAAWIEELTSTSQTDGYASYVVASIRQHGKYGIEQDLNSAIKHYYAVISDRSDKDYSEDAELFDRAQFGWAECLKWRGVEAETEVEVDPENGSEDQTDLISAYDTLNKIAEEDDHRCQRQACLELADFFRKGLFVTRNLSQAIEYYQRAMPLPMAAYKLALCYENGNGVSQDHHRAFGYLNRCVVNPEAPPAALYQMGCYYLQDDTKRGLYSDLESALRYFKKAEQAGSSLASVSIYELYGKNFGGTQAEAIEGYHKLLDQDTTEDDAKVKAAYRLGVFYAEKGEYQAARKWHELAVEHHDPVAWYELGMVYMTSSVSNVSNVIEAKYCFQQAEASDEEEDDKLTQKFKKNLVLAEQQLAEKIELATRGDIEAQIALGELYEKSKPIRGGNAKRAFDYYCQAASTANSFAQYKVAYCYQNGTGVMKEMDTAKTLYLKSATNSKSPSPEAMYELAKLHLTAKSSAPEKEEGFKWLTKCLECPKPLAEALNLMGDLYYVGVPEVKITKDLNTAAIYYKKAAGEGCASAAINLYRRLYEKNLGGGTPEEAVTGYQQWYKKLDKDHPQYGEVALYLGLCFLAGRGVQKNVISFRHYVTVAASTKLPVALDVLGLSYQQGYEEPMIPPDLKKAANCFQQCIEEIKCKDDESTDKEYLGKVQQAYQNVQKLEQLLKRLKNGEDSVAIELGECYEFGRLGVRQNDKTAIRYYQMAARKNLSLAHYKVGRCYQEGIGVKQDLKEAKKAYDKGVYHEFPNPHAKYGLARYYNALTPPDKGAAFGWLVEATKIKREAPVEALYELGLCYEKGVPERKIAADAKIAAQHFRFALRKSSYWPAAQHLYNLYAENKAGGTLREAKEGFHRFIKHVGIKSKYYGEIAFHLGRCYSLEKDYKESAHFYKVAAEQQEPRGLLWLAKCYQGGCVEAGISRDLKIAKSYFEQTIVAIEKGRSERLPYEIELAEAKKGLAVVQQLIDEAQAKPEDVTMSVSEGIDSTSLTQPLRDFSMSSSSTSSGSSGGSSSSFFNLPNPWANSSSSSSSTSSPTFLPYPPSPRTDP
ncbi:MAG: hypothetical protein QM752_03790 [Gammaproteobacteria bacterium]